MITTSVMLQQHLDQQNLCRGAAVPPCQEASHRPLVESDRHETLTATSTTFNGNVSKNLQLQNLTLT